MSAGPKISVLMSVFNGAGEIGGALASLQAQTFADWEALIVDDASTDDTGAVVARWAAHDPRIRYRRLPQNVGPGAARNVALAAARGAWITLLDADDVFAPDRLATLHARAERDGLDVLADNLTLYDEAEARALGPAFDLGGESLALSARLLAANDAPPRMIVPGQLKPFVRRAFLAETGVTYPEDLRVGEDFLFLFQLLQRTARARVVAYCGYRYTLPFSPRAGTRAAGTRTAHDDSGLGALRRGTERLIAQARAAPRPDARLIASLARRQRRLGDEDLWRRARARWRARDFVAGAALLARLDPAFGLAQAAAIWNRRRGRVGTRLR